MNATSETAYKRITVSPIAGSLGAEIGGVDCTKPLDDEVFAEVHHAWLENIVIYFRNQDMNPEKQIAFAKQWGDVHLHAFNRPVDGYPEITQIRKTPDMPRVSGNAWHTDQHYRDKPAKMTILFCYECPEYGGDTQFANLYDAYDGLSDGMKRDIASLFGVANGDSRKHQSGYTRAEREAAGFGTIKQMKPLAVNTIASHPLVRTHPETKRKALYIGKHMECIEGWTEEESYPLLQFLLRHATKPDYIGRIRWKPGTLTIWDNRCALHYATDDYPGQYRRLHKIMVQGDKPF